VPLAPQWPVHQRVRALCSDRAGGVSPAPYDTLNLGDHVGDLEAHVAANRERFAATLGARPVYMRQVHGTHVARLAPDTPQGVEADACWTTEPGLACTIMVADCLPVLLADARGRAVAAAHCGWRGLAGDAGRGVLENLWAAVAPHLSDPVVWLGPCIGPTAFEVGPEVREAFTAHDPAAAACFRPHAEGKFLADLPALARRRLAALGLSKVHGNDGSLAWCTVSNPSRFFSHRRDRTSGRFAASIWLA
jgi:YfiH family protein